MEGKGQIFKFMFDYGHNFLDTGLIKLARAARAEVHARAIGHDRVAGNPSLAPLPEERPETPEFDGITSITPHMSFMGRPALYVQAFTAVVLVKFMSHTPNIP